MASSMYLPRLGYLRFDRVMSVEALAAAISVDPSSLRKWESGRQRVRIKHVEPIAAALGLTSWRELLHPNPLSEEFSLEELLRVGELWALGMSDPEAAKRVIPMTHISKFHRTPTRSAALFRAACQQVRAERDSDAGLLEAEAAAACDEWIESRRGDGADAPNATTVGYDISSGAGPAASIWAAPVRCRADLPKGVGSSIQAGTLVYVQDESAVYTAVVAPRRGWRLAFQRRRTT